MPRARDHLRRVALLDDAALVHHRHTVGDRRDDGEVVAHVDDRDPPLRAQPLDLLEDPRLRDDVEAGRRLVHDDDRRLAHERRRDRDALLLPAGELMRVAPCESGIRGEMHAPERLQHAASSRPTAVLARDVAHGVAHSQGRIQCRRRVLRDVRDDTAAMTPCLGLVETGESHACDLDGARDDPAPRTRVPEQRQGERRLPRPRLADEPEDLARPDRDRDVVDRSPSAGKLHREALGVEDGAHVRAPTSIAETPC